MAKTVVILGAGSSHSAGVPLLKNFLAEARKLYDSGANDISRSDFALAFQLIDDRLQRLYAKSVVDLDNVESVFSLVEWANVVKRLPGTEKSEIPAVRRAIKRLLVETVERRCLFEIAQDGHWMAPEAYRDLIDRLIEGARWKQGCAIITFNWDVAVDFAAYAKGIQIDYGFGKPLGPGTLLILKPHGSLHWNHCPECGKIRPLNFERVFQLMGNHRYPTGKRPLDVLAALTGMDSCCGRVNPDPGIVPPTITKTEHHGSFAAVWERAAQELSEASEIHVVGYSMPQSDTFFREMLALSLEGPTHVQQFTVVNPDGAVGQRVKQWIGPALQNRFRTSPGHFEAWVRADDWLF